MKACHIETVRAFHRLVTQRAGALESGFLGRDRPLGESRVLWEIGEEGADLRELRARLRLDSGYLSRLTGSLEDAGLVTVEPLATDERVRRASLTGHGRSEVAEMDRRADALAASILAPLAVPQRERLTAAMETVIRLLRLSALRIERADPAAPEARRCVGRFCEELGARFPEGFDATRSLPADDADLTPPRGAFLLATVDGAPVACGAVKETGPGVGSIKRMWVDAALRGLGVGRRILSRLEEEARALGLTTLRLETHGVLTEALHLYRTSGYREVDPFNDDPYARHWFEKRLEP